MTEKGHHVHAVMLAIVAILVIGAIVLGAAYVDRGSGGERDAEQVIATVDGVIRDAGLEVCSRDDVTWNAAAGAEGGASWIVTDSSCDEASTENVVVAQAFDSAHNRDNALRNFQSGQSRRRLDGQAWAYGDAVVIVQGPTSRGVADRLQTQLEAAGLE